MIVLCAILKAKYGEDANEAIEMVMEDDKVEYEQLQEAADEMVSEIPPLEEEIPDVKYTPIEEIKKEELTQE